MQSSETITFGEALRLDRTERGWSQKTIADMVGGTQQNVGNWERGENLPKRDAYEKLVEVLGPDSRIAHARLRGEIVLNGSAGFAGVLKSKAFDPGQPSVRFSYAEAIEDTDAPRALRAEENVRHTYAGDFQATQRPVVDDAMWAAHPVIRGLRDALPTKWQKWVGQLVSYKRHRYLVAYSSPELCLVLAGYRVGTAFGGNPTGMTRGKVRAGLQDAMRKLLILRALDDNAEGSNSRAYVAVAVPYDGTTAGVDGLLSPQTEDEAELLGLRCYHAANARVVAAIVQSYEDPAEPDYPDFDGPEF